MKKTISAILIFTVSCLLYGCKKEPNAPQVRVVTGITVTATNNLETQTHTYTQNKEMCSILNYLRLLDPYVSVPLAPDTFRSDIYNITVFYSDGSQTQYNQIYHDYFQTNGGAWKRIDPKVGSRLKDIVEYLAADI